MDICTIHCSLFSSTLCAIGGGVKQCLQGNGSMTLKFCAKTFFLRIWVILCKALTGQKF